MEFFIAEPIDGRSNNYSGEDLDLTDSDERQDAMDANESDYEKAFEAQSSMYVGQRAKSHADHTRGTGSEVELGPFGSHFGQYSRAQILSQNRMPELSSLKSMPAELLQQVAIYAASDSDLRNFNLSSMIFAHTIGPNTSGVWHKRFLAKYDFPFIDSFAEFAVAYKLRHFVLNNFISFEGDEVAKMRIQLEVVLEMIIETYNRNRSHLPWPSQSRNLAVFESVNQSTWMMKLLGCPLYASRMRKYGKRCALFESVQLALSHFVLSHKSPIATLINTSRSNYDLVKVYNFNQNFRTLFERLPGSAKPKPHVGSAKYTKPTRRGHKQIEPKYSLDLNALLHIRNFWQRHLVDNAHGLSENTYAGMSKALVRWNSYPRPWSHPLHLSIKLVHVWHGMYSCLDPWPKSRDDLEERQSSAEEWTAVDPMKLEFVSSEGNEFSCLWPPSFDDIPVFHQTIPRGEYAKHLHCVYLRGIAPFINLSQIQGAPSQHRTRDESKLFLKYHPFTAARVRGVVHDIPASATLDDFSIPKKMKTRINVTPELKHTIPGWKRIVMIMYRVFPRHLISLLEHTIEEYGVASTVSTHNTANVWNNTSEPPKDDTESEDEPSPNVNVITPNIDQVPLSVDTGTEDANSEQTPENLNRILAKRIRQFTRKYRKRLNLEAQLPPEFRANLPALFSTDHINQLEDSFVPSAYLSWDDETTQIIEYAYAYEGVIIPGGQIMMGRWWRVHGSEGLGPGREVGTGGVGVRVRRVKDDDERNEEDANEDDMVLDENSDGGYGEGTSACNARDDGVGDGRKVEFITQVNGEETRAVNGCKGLERGPFVFWACD